MLGSTIAAISTPPGKGGVALIRISGANALTIADACFRAKSEKPLSLLPQRQAVYGDIRKGGKSIDDGIAIYYKAPHSYTGEDMVELICHGGILLTETVLSAVFAAGAEPAEAGEFTKRAYLNGKISLSEAEAVAQLLEAKTESQLAISTRAAGAKLKAAVAALAAELTSLLSSLYAAIDYPEEDLAELSCEEVVLRLKGTHERVQALSATYRTGHAISHGIPTVICGRPNVGKSSLYNRLCQKECAIVTDEAGTTRDVLERTVTVGKATLLLYDTAGLRETDSKAEKLGVDRALACLKEAELILAVFDGAAPLQKEDMALLKELASLTAPTVAILNKLDRGTRKETMAEIAKVCPAVLCLSAKEGDITALTQAIEGLFIDEKLTLGESAIVASARQKASFDRATELLSYAIASFEGGMATDVSATVVEEAISALGEIDGRQVSEQIVGEIFSHFCVGK